MGARQRSRTCPPFTPGTSYPRPSLPGTGIADTNPPLTTRYSRQVLSRPSQPDTADTTLPHKPGRRHPPAPHNPGTLYTSTSQSLTTQTQVSFCRVVPGQWNNERTVGTTGSSIPVHTGSQYRSSNLGSRFRWSSNIDPDSNNCFWCDDLFVIYLLSLSPIILLLLVFLCSTVVKKIID